MKALARCEAGPGRPLLPGVIMIEAAAQLRFEQASWPCLRSWRWLPEVSRKDIYSVDRATKLHEVLSTAGDHLSIEKNIAENHVEHGLRHRLTQRNLGRMWLFGG